MLKSCVLVASLLSFTASQSAADTITAYCACKKCCGRWSGGPTKSGAMPQQGVTVAGPVGFKMGTRVMIEGVGVRVVQDRTAARYNGRWDVFFNSHEDARQFGIRERKVKVIK